MAWKQLKPCGFEPAWPPKRLQGTELILHELGLDPEEAFKLLLAQIELRDGGSFEVRRSPAEEARREAPLLSAEQQGRIWDEALGECG